MLEPGRAVFILIAFEGPDVYSQAGGLGVRVKELSRALAERDYETHLFFIGDPSRPANEALNGNRLHLHRWSQWISRFYPAGVYSGEDDKVQDINRSLPDYCLREVVQPTLDRGQIPVVMGEEWHIAHALNLISDRLHFAGLRDRSLLLWNANNHYAFHRINWGSLSYVATITTVSRYMKHIMWQWGVNPVVIPNGIPSGLTAPADPAQVGAIRQAAAPAALLFKIGRFSPDKRWHQAIAALARLKARGLPFRLLMRGGQEPFGGEVIEFARRLQLRVDDVREPIPDAAALAQALKAHREADCINLQTFLPDSLLPAVYAAAVATLANSGHEPFGLVGLEAMASGGIAFVGATGEDYAQAFRNAIVIETEDAAEVAAYLIHLNERPDLGRRLRLEARRTAREFSWNRAIDILLRRLEFVALRQGIEPKGAGRAGGRRAR